MTTFHELQGVGRHYRIANQRKVGTWTELRRHTDDLAIHPSCTEGTVCWVVNVRSQCLPIDELSGSAITGSAIIC
jgi:hypothetical protein